MHVKITNGIPEIYTIGQLRRDNPRTSFPKSIPIETLAAYGVYPLEPTERPDAGHAKNVVETTPKQVDGVWTQDWAISDASPEEVAVRTSERAQSVRSERDYALSQSDWVVIKHTEKGTNIPLEWEVYRQDLRDITDQSGFPFEIVWPVKP